MNETTFVLFGATGDLAKRKIFPALYNLFLDRKITSPFTVVGLGRRTQSDEDFQTYVKESLQSFSRRELVESDELNTFISHFHFHALDVNNKEDYHSLCERIVKLEKENQTKNRLFYLSVAPEFFDVAAMNIKESGLSDVKGWKRLLIEKPFGHDLASAHALNTSLLTVFPEDEVYRIDHYLGKNMVQNLKTLKFENPIFQHIWNKEHIANVQITAIEAVGVEERAGYYDHTGAIRDMFQNHLLQIASLVAMDDYRDSNIRLQKKKVLENLRSMTKEEVKQHFVRGQYTKGMVNGKETINYIDEPGVSPDSTTETFLATRVMIDNDQWRGVPFYIRTGKHTSGKSTKIVLEFRHDGKASTPNSLVIEINPNEEITLFVNSDQFDSTRNVEQIALSFKQTSVASQEAYEKLIYDALLGDASFFAQWDEVRLSWEYVQPILDAVEDKTLPVYPYSAGTNGPKEADELLHQDGFKWN